MSPSRTTILLAIPSILGIATAIPALLAPRDQVDYITNNYGQETTVFPTGYPTCGNDKSMSGFSTTITVNTRPDCDNVIDTICRAAEVQASPNYSAHHNNIGNIGYAIGTCEGHILAPHTNTNVTYAVCVNRFQSITETCILLDGPKNYAAVGKQYGLRNLQYNSAASIESPQGLLATWQANSDTESGYLMGPPNVFGTDFMDVDAESILGGS
ncbi:hypothetical protein BDR22DRAFT_243969 [Usnea florida]